MTAGQRIGLGLLVTFYAVAGIAHLVVTDAMVRIVPGWVPYPHAVVIATGVCELFGAAGLCLPRWRMLAGRMLALYALCVWPANVQHAIIDLSHGTGLPIWYHAPRLAAQPLLIWWAWWAARIGRKKSSPDRGRSDGCRGWGRKRCPQVVSAKPSSPTAAHACLPPPGGGGLAG